MKRFFQKPYIDTTQSNTGVIANKDILRVDATMKIAAPAERNWCEVKI
jgi:hypothetical protein